jgi:hypothetical protein
MTVDFNSLLVPAKSEEMMEAEAKGLVTTPKKAKHELHKLKKTARARLIAQEFVRNGMNLRSAIHTVTGSNPKSNSNGIMTLLGDSTDVFVEELSSVVSKSDVDRERALSLLWAMVNTSILDFIDDHGHVLPVPELRKLPRIMQIMLSKIDVSTKQHTVRGEDGKIMRDDNGSPYLATEQRVRIELPERMLALGQLAQIMRWVGPSVLVQNNINIGRLMSDADGRRDRAEIIYEQARTLDQ